MSPLTTLTVTNIAHVCFPINCVVFPGPKVFLLLCEIVPRTFNQLFSSHVPDIKLVLYFTKLRFDALVALTQLISEALSNVCIVLLRLVGKLSLVHSHHTLVKLLHTDI